MGSDPRTPPFAGGTMRPTALAVLAVLAAARTGKAQTIPAPPDTLASACAAAPHRQFDFWLGRWRVAPLGRPAGGASEITRVAQGCAVREEYHNARGYTGTSLNQYDPASRSWSQLWVDNAGLILRLAGGLDAEGRMVLLGDRSDHQGPLRDRISWVPRPDGTVHQIWDVSRDGGESWQNLFTGQYVRVPESP
jgi:hypothetical protein